MKALSALQVTEIIISCSLTMKICGAFSFDFLTSMESIQGEYCNRLEIGEL